LVRFTEAGKWFPAFFRFGGTVVAFNRDGDDEPVPYDDGYGDEHYKVFTQVIHVPDHGAIGYNGGFQDGLNRGEANAGWMARTALVSGIAIGLGLGLVLGMLFADSRF
jgi:hypothetical protein